RIDGNHIAPRRVEPYAALDELGEPVELGFVAGHVVVALVVAVDEDGDREASDSPCGGRRVLGDAVDFPVAGPASAQHAAAEPTFGRFRRSFGQVAGGAGYVGDRGALGVGALVRALLAAERRFRRLVVLFGAIAHGGVEVDTDTHIGAPRTHHFLGEGARL